MLTASLLEMLDGGDASDLIDTIASALAMSPPKALERAAALLVWKRAWTSAFAPGRQGGDRRSAHFQQLDQNEKISFCSMASRTIGVGERSVQLDVALAEQLGAVDIRRLWTSPICDNGAALRTVAALDLTGRTTLFSIWRERPALGFAAAMRAARLREDADSEALRFSRLLDGWQRAGSASRRRFLVEIGCDPKAADAVLTAWRKRGGQ